MNTLACMLLDSISELSYDDADFVIDVVEQYLSQIPGDEVYRRTAPAAVPLQMYQFQ